MNKKPLLFFSIISLGISGLFLTGCKEEEDTKVPLTYGHVYKENISSVTDLPELKYEDLKSKISHEDSFLLAVYNSTCSCWDNFGPVLTEFINKYHVNVEYIEVSQLANQTEKYGLHTVKGDMPSISVFHKGLLVDQQVYGLNDNKIFRGFSYFEEYINSKVYMPKMYYVEKDVLDSFISLNIDFNLYIARSECPDCQAIDKNVLRAWNEKYVSVTELLYIFDVQPYWASEKAGNTREEVEAYELLKKQYGLTTDNNPDFGYDLYNGAVPTFQRRKGSQINDMSVFLNDTLMKDEKKVSSYFTSERVEKMSYLEGTTLTKVLDGMALTDAQYANWWATYSEEFYETYHYPLANAFINYYVK